MKIQCVLVLLLWSSGDILLLTASTNASELLLPKKGICLWSHGRSGSGTIAQTFRNSLKLDFCKHVKEGFRFQYPRLKFLVRCLQGRAASPPLRFTHVKPRHVTHSAKQPAQSFDEKVALVHQFVRNLKTAGFGVLLVHRRPNTLAMLISDYELRYKQAGALRLQRVLERELTEVVCALQYHHVVLEEGLRAAVSTDLPVVETDFSALTGEGACVEYLRVFAAMNSLGLDIPPRLASSCEKVDAHVSAGRPRRRSLEARLGNVTAARVRAELAGTAYEWMLDLSSEQWPGRGPGNPCKEEAQSFSSRARDAVDSRQHYVEEGGALAAMQDGGQGRDPCVPLSGGCSSKSVLVSA